jgi:hypothetical protein
MEELKPSLLTGKFGPGSYIAARFVAAMIPRAVGNGCFPGINTSGGMEGYFVFFRRETAREEPVAVGTGTLVEAREMMANQV